MKEKLKQIIKGNQLIKKLYTHLNFKYHKVLFSKNPKQLANLSYKRHFKKNINWDNPQDIIEKTIWQQFNTDTSLWTKCSDKYLVREYIKEIGEEKLLCKLYGHYNKVDDINFEKLPKQFVIKSNNACGTVLLVKDKSKLKQRKTEKILKKWMNFPYGMINAQLHYLKIKPCIIIEELLSNDSNNTPLIDYKFYCFNGEVDSILVCYNRNIETHDYTLKLYNKNWEDISYNLIKFTGKTSIRRPSSLNEMIRACRKIGKNIPFVRIDFYEVNNKPYFGEMTFTMGFGYLTKDFYLYLGSKVNLKK